ncbi:hypothetical protein TBR22_A20650 [Luteitalea sp. TBR-22]|uniref:DUF3810 family protein n=1 Tax=Luteitalea sp. TBR-22 TaxID=2802971 RepID=UPI001AFC5D7D|nr:hypothetical protein TBR22_A20650 [Luteitalea sp. TBR-22]
MDACLLVLVGALAWLVWSRRLALLRPMPVVLGLAAVAAAWLVFLLAWGWHYQVPTVEVRLGLTPAEVTVERGEAFAAGLVAQLNALHGAAHAAGFPSRPELPSVLAPLMADALSQVGQPWTPWLPRPRRTMLDVYFRNAGIDGMTNPFGLEVLLNSRVLPMELPALAAHEYAHLAGFADEADASIVAWLACQRGSAALKYSSGLAVLPHVLTGLDRERRQRVLAALGEGPRADLRAIAARLAEQRPWVQLIAWQTYDRFLKANRVAEGVARYDAVARVLVGAGDIVSGTLRRRPSPWPAPRRR